MLKRLTALFAILVLLLPGSLAAVAFSGSGGCAGNRAAPSCCCAPARESNVPGPHMQRTCCCKFDAPLSLPSVPDQERVESGVDFEVSLLAPTEAASLLPVSVPLMRAPRFMAQLRGPPTDLFLKYSRFLC
jgi:hypothetical protein